MFGFIILQEKLRCFTCPLVFGCWELSHTVNPKFALPHSKLLAVISGLWPVLAEQHAKYIWFLPQTSQEGNKCTLVYHYSRVHISLVGLSLDTAFQHLFLMTWRAGDLNFIMISSLASKYQDFKLRGLQFLFIKQVSQL